MKARAETDDEKRLRVLLRGPSDRSEWDLAVRYIEQGYARGIYHRPSSGPSNDPDVCVYDGPIEKALPLEKELRARIAQASVWSKIKPLLIAGGGLIAALAGIYTVATYYR